MKLLLPLPCATCTPLGGRYTDDLIHITFAQNPSQANTISNFLASNTYDPSMKVLPEKQNNPDEYDFVGHTIDKHHLHTFPLNLIFPLFLIQELSLRKSLVFPKLTLMFLFPFRNPNSLALSAELLIEAHPPSIIICHSPCYNWIHLQWLPYSKNGPLQCLKDSLHLIPQVHTIIESSHFHFEKHTRTSHSNYHQRITSLRRKYSRPYFLIYLFLSLPVPSPFIFYFPKLVSAHSLLIYSIYLPTSFPPKIL